MLRGLVVVLLLVLCLACGEREAAWPKITPTWPIIHEVPTLRLPPGVTPVSQQLELSIDPSADRYTGHTSIEVEVAASTSIIWLNGRDLRVGDVSVTPAGSGPLRANYTEQDGSGFASIRTVEPVPRGRARIDIRFGAALQTGTRLGVYKLVVDGQPYVFTQLQPIAARSVFPCFDEPGFKIPYDIALSVPRGLRVVANSREVSRTELQRLDSVVFATTEKLPSYLIAFAVGDFDVVEAEPIPPNAIRSDAIPLRGFTTKRHGERATFALAQVGPLLTKLEEYAGIPYAYGKLDIIAVPDKNGAMENPGAITMNASSLLDATDSEFVRRLYTEMMAHELAHMWVGDLVTLAWWDDVWLNEAFAAWLAVKAAHAWAPDLTPDLHMRWEARSRLQDDSLPGARAIREPIRSDDDIEAAFDRIVYEKGAVVISMFERWLGEEVWQRGFRAYLTKHRHANATTADLLAEIDAATGKDVSVAIESFLNNRGAPVVSATLRCSPSGGAAHVELGQARYLPIASDPDDTLWGVPVCVRYGGRVAGDACTLLSGRSGTLPLPESAGCPAWVLPNVDGDGYYYASIGASDRMALRKNGLSSLSKAARESYARSLKDDYERGTISYGEALETVTSISFDEPSAGELVLSLAAEARLGLAGDPLVASVERYVRGAYGPTVRRLGYEQRQGESVAIAGLRRLAIRCLALVGGDPAVRREAKRRGMQSLAAGDSDRRFAALGAFAGVALEVAGQEADEATFERLVELALAGDDTQRWRVREALLAVRDPSAVERLHDAMMQDGEVGELKRDIVVERFSNRDFATTSWDLLVANSETMLRPMMEMSAALWPLDVVEQLCDSARIEQAEKVLPPLVEWVDEGATYLHRALAKARLCVAARKVHEPQMRAFFQSK